MAEKTLYRWSLSEAQKLGEVDLWRESYKENCTCARAIEDFIASHYSENTLNTDGIEELIDRFGFNRLNWVLANTIQRKEADGRIREENKAWARSTYIPNDDIRWHYEVDSHAGLTDLFTNRVRKEWNSLGLFEKKHCTNEGDYEGKVLALKPSVLKHEYQSPDYQLFYATSGFGCDPSKIGTAVYGYFLKDDEHTNFRRQDFIGVVDEEYLPDWAKEKLEQQGSDESEDITIGGMQQ